MLRDGASVPIQVADIPTRHHHQRKRRWGGRRRVAWILQVASISWEGKRRKEGPRHKKACQWNLIPSLPIALRTAWKKGNLGSGGCGDKTTNCPGPPWGCGPRPCIRITSRSFKKQLDPVWSWSKMWAWHLYISKIYTIYTFKKQNKIYTWFWMLSWVENHG